MYINKKIKRFGFIGLLFVLLIVMIFNLATSRFHRTWQSDKIQTQIPTSFSIGDSPNKKNQYYLEYMTIGPYDTSHNYNSPEQMLPKGRCYLVHKIGERVLLLAVFNIDEGDVSVEELSDLIEVFSSEGKMKMGSQVIKKNVIREIFCPYEL